jgi:hypothetical protein
MTEYSKEAGRRLAEIVRMPKLDLGKASDIAQAVIDRPTKIGDELFREAFLEIFGFDTLKSLRYATGTNQLIEIARQIESRFFPSYSSSLQKSLRETLRSLISSSQQPGYFSATDLPSQEARASNIQKEARSQSVSKPELVLSATPASKPMSTINLKADQYNHQVQKPSKRFALIVSSLACLAIGFIVGLINIPTLIGLAFLLVIVGVPVFIFKYLKAKESRGVRIAFSVLGIFLGNAAFVIGGAIGSAASGAS